MSNKFSGGRFTWVRLQNLGFIIPINNELSIIKYEKYCWLYFIYHVFLPSK